MRVEERGALKGGGELKGGGTLHETRPLTAAEQGGDGGDASRDASPHCDGALCYGVAIPTKETLPLCGGAFDQSAAPLTIHMYFNHPTFDHSKGLSTVGRLSLQ